MFKETKLRSVIKTFSWRLLATLTTALLVFIFTGKIKIALTIGGFEALAKIIFYFFHERLWDKIKFGRKQVVPFVLWFTGLPASGKSTLGDAVHSLLSKRAFIAERLDGNKVREIFPETGFSKGERDEHIKRIGLLAGLLEKNNVIVVASFISPWRNARDFVRSICNNFIEVYINTPLEVCEQRDPNGLYKKAREGAISNFTGVDDPYQPPQNPDIVIDTSSLSVEAATKRILKYLEKRNFLS